MNWITDICNWWTRNLKEIESTRDLIAYTIEQTKTASESVKETIDSTEEIVDDVEKVVEVVKEKIDGVLVDEKEEEVKEGVKLLTENKIFIWSECSCPRLPKIGKSEIFNPKNVIVTSHDPTRKSYIKQKEAIQKKGGLVFLCVHPWYKPWKGKSVEECAKYTKNYVSDYDGVIIDLEGVYKKKLDETIKCFTGVHENLWVAPMMRKDYLSETYAKLKDWNVHCLWWNYSNQLTDWNSYFDKYKFNSESKHNLLLSFRKYLKHVSLAEIKNIVENAPLRVGSFNPKTGDKTNMNKMKKELSGDK
jgi:hypothetical protein